MFTRTFKINLVMQSYCVKSLISDCLNHYFKQFVNLSHFYLKLTKSITNIRKKELKLLDVL